MASFSGSPGNDIFTGGNDNDTAWGAGGADSISGADGHDVLAGGAGRDSLDGGAGDDILYSADPSPTSNLPYYGNTYVLPVVDTGTEVDTLIGGDGADRIFAGYGDNVDGGAGGSYGDYLYISFQGAPAGVTADFGLATQTIGGGVITGIENISYVQGSQFGDNLNLRSTGNSGYSDFATVSGMDGNDTLTAGYYTGTLFGDAGDDVIDGRPSQYLMSVEGGAGNDTLYTDSNTFATALGGPGDDQIFAHGETHGGEGADVIVMQQTYYSQRVFGDEGDDRIDAAASANSIAGGAGADTLTGAGGADTLYSADYLGSSSTAADDMGLEHDRIVGGGGADALAIGYGDDADGGAGSDTLRLSLGGLTHGLDFDTSGIVSGNVDVGGGIIQNIESLLYVRGTDFADTLRLRTQNVLLSVDAGAGDDVIISQSSSVAVRGGEGADRFVSGVAGDSFDGGSGTDTIDYSAATAGVSVDLVAGTGSGGDALISVEAIQGSGFGDTLAGDAGLNTILGGLGDDVIRDAGGQNYLRGNEGDDNLTGGAGFDDVHGNQGNDTVSGGGGDDWVVGGQDNDLQSGGDGFDVVYGNLGADTVNGDAGDDWVRGGQQADVLSGGAGDDWMSGDRDGDTLTGGAGADTFNLFTGSGVDRITDFSLAEGDHIRWEGGVPDYAIAQVGADTVISYGSGDQVTLAGVSASSLGDTGWFVVG